MIGRLEGDRRELDRPRASWGPRKKHPTHMRTKITDNQASGRDRLRIEAAGDVVQSRVRKRFDVVADLGGHLKFLCVQLG
jgi:hypothetical protein